jgi:2-polyprenyl-6-methoxyphenol hydroxylase-like FAD-dependent oxidoreductase
MREDPRQPSTAPTDRAHAVSRATLRRLLLAGLEAEVTFGKEFVRFERLPDTKLKAIFADGDFITGDVLVGADGVNSRVRRQLLPDARVIDTDGIGIGGKLPLNADVEAWLPSPLLHGKNMILPERDFLFTAVFRRRMSSSTPDSSHALAPLSSDLAKADAEEADYIMWAYVARRRIESSADSSAMAGLHGEALRGRVEQSISHWHADLRRLIAESDASSIQLFDFRAAARIRPWQSTNVTLLGDAVHAMPPVGGIGGNVALCDAARLSRALKEVAEGQDVPRRRLEQLRSRHAQARLCRGCTVSTLSPTRHFAEPHASGCRTHILSRLWSDPLASPSRVRLIAVRLIWSPVTG